MERMNKERRFLQFWGLAATASGEKPERMARQVRVLLRTEKKEHSLLLFEELISSSYFFYAEVAIMVNENQFQASLIKELKSRFPESVVMKLDPKYKQGVPDLLILNGSKWATLECKKSAKAPHQPNQDYYISKMNDMSFSRVIYPENKNEVLDELQRTFES